MKLHKSISMLQQGLSTLQERPEFDGLWASKVGFVFREYTAKGKTFADIETRLMWDLWWALPTIVRDDIVDASIARAEWVGGYPDVTDAHLNTLLRKVMVNFVRDSVEQMK